MDQDLPATQRPTISAADSEASLQAVVEEQDIATEFHCSQQPSSSRTAISNITQVLAQLFESEDDDLDASEPSSESDSDTSDSDNNYSDNNNSDNSDSDSSNSDNSDSNNSDSKDDMASNVLSEAGNNLSEDGLAGNNSIENYQLLQQLVIDVAEEAKDVEEDVAEEADEAEEA